MFSMSADEVANEIVYLFGKGIRLEILQYVIDRVGVSRVAKAAGKKPQSVSTAIYKKSLGDELSYALFKAIAENWPEILKAAIITVNNRYKDKFEKLGINLDKIFEEKLEAEV
jgi:hypothetical protein